MRVPEWVARHFELGEDAWREWRGFGGGVYPPPGFLPLPLLEVGNGDLYGLYWPLGREDAPPLVCTTLHDSWHLLPIATSVEGCLRLEYVARRAVPDGEEEEDGEDDAAEVRETAELLGVALPDVRPPVGAVEYWGVSRAADLLPLDSGSPHLLLLDGRERNAAGNAAGAEESLRAALALLPEYTDALYWLGQVLRRHGRAAEANAALLDALGSPLAFCSGDVRRRALDQLKRARGDDALPPGCAGDPLWEARHRLTLATGVKTNDDFPLYEEVVEAYHTRGEGIRAVRLRVLVGELFSAETVSFQARYGWSREGWREQLRSDLTRAGLMARLVTV